MDSDERNDQQSVPAPGVARKPRLLLAEDDEDMRAMLVAVLERKGWDVVAVGDGVGLLDRIQSGTWSRPEAAFDVVLTDINMPDFTAFEILAAVRCGSFATPVVFITASDVDELPAGTTGLELATIFRKPLDFDALDVALRRLAAGRSSGHATASGGVAGA